MCYNDVWNTFSIWHIKQAYPFCLNASRINYFSNAQTVSSRVANAQSVNDWKVVYDEDWKYSTSFDQLPVWRSPDHDELRFSRAQDTQLRNQTLFQSNQHLRTHYQHSTVTIVEYIYRTQKRTKHLHIWLGYGTIYLKKPLETQAYKPHTRKCIINNAV